MLLIMKVNSDCGARIAITYCSGVMQCLYCLPPMLQLRLKVHALTVTRWIRTAIFMISYPLFVAKYSYGDM